MALVKFGAGIVQMAGSIAGTTYARNRSGNYARARTKPKNPRTALQTAVRSAIAVLCTAWSETLDAAERTSWGAYAAAVAMKNRLGEVTFLSGFNQFIRSNLPLLQAGEELIEAGPTVLELPEQDETITAVGDVGDNKINVTFSDALPWANEDGGFLHVFMGQPVNPQRNFFAGPYRYAGSVAGATLAPPASPAAIDPPFALVAGQKVWCQFRIQRADGRLSEPFRSDALVIA